MSKKLLNEAQMRRFMGLAGIQPSVVSNKITEWYRMQNEGEYNKDEEVVQEEAVEDEELPPEDEMPADDEGAPEDEMPPVDLDAEEEPEAVSALGPQALAMELIDALAPVFEKHGVELSASEDAAPAADDDMGDALPPEDAELPPMDAAPEGGEELEPAPEEEIEEVSLQLTQEEVVSEVARRVINRIRKAKKAKNTFDKALGNK